MSRILSTNIRNTKKRNEARATPTTTKPRKSIVTLDEFRTRAVLTPSGQRTTLLAMTPDDFRAWFNAFLAAVEPHIKASDGVKVIIEQTKIDVQTLPLYEEARLYCINNVYETKAFRRSGIAIFVSDEEVSA